MANGRSRSGGRRVFHLPKKAKVKKIMVKQLGRLGRFLGRVVATALRGGKSGKSKVVSDPNTGPVLPENP